MQTKARERMLPSPRGTEHAPSRHASTRHPPRALDLVANCIWFTALATYAVGPSIFVVLGTMEILHWWVVASQAA